MSNVLQVCIYNTEPSASAELQARVKSLNLVRLVGEYGCPEELAAALGVTGIHLVFCHLDPNPSEVLRVVEQLATRFPDVALIAISHERGPDAIIAPIRAGCDQFVCEPIDDKDFASAVARVVSRRLLGRAKNRCICVTGASGGVGATSIACNLALELAQVTETKCALVDLDPQFGDVATSFDCDPQYTIYHLATSGTEIDDAVLQKVLRNVNNGVHVLARPDLLEQHDMVTPDFLHHAIDVLTKSFETVVIDLPRRVDMYSFAATSQADLILIVCQLVVPSIRNTKRYYDGLVGSGIPAERIEVVVNRGDSSGGRITIDDLESLIEKPVYCCIPNDYQFVARSLDFGQPVASLDRHNPVRAAIRKIAEKIVGESSGEECDEARKGFFSRLLSK